MPDAPLRYLTDLVAAAHEVLGDDLRGAYAAGSVGLGAYEPGRSDVDVALVCAARLDFRVSYGPADRPPADGLFWYGGPLVDAATTALVNRSIAARDGGPPPSGPQARAFQRRVLADLTGTPA
ncbi:hypothetical protein [Micromonospora craniellae]|uniref:Nucleotidyltransferase domain-containing protein n=1 Tax=Micromonospora craniellae TaxID=2294034 RepID=A0A372FZF6_9ACTN|nr:hypothetical protein [Micromonospora craniellae]QOC90942.1 hypothetical protein ID554_23205 [Micromonospora craniellae]RFS45916.1 hypothetical protein D0Q02_13645 [Micromonospora craniellae]